MKRISNILYDLSKWMTIAIVALMTIVVVLEVFCRNVLGFSFKWTEEMARYLQVWLVFIGGSVAFKNRSLVGFTFLTEHLSPALQRWAGAISKILLTVFLLVVLYYSVLQVTSPSVLRQVSAGLRLPMFWAYLAIPLGVAFMLIHLVAQRNEKGGISSRGD